MASTALVVALGGISRQWIQPVAFLLGKTKVDAAPLQALLVPLTTDLRVVVKAVVCGLGSSNISISKDIGVTPEHPFFEVGGEKVYFFFDTPRRLKCTRNKFRNRTILKIVNQKTKWSHIQKV